MAELPKKQKADLCPVCGSEIEVYHVMTPRKQDYSYYFYDHEMKLRCSNENCETRRTETLSIPVDKEEEES